MAILLILILSLTTNLTTPLVASNNASAPTSFVISEPIPSKSENVTSLLVSGASRLRPWKSYLSRLRAAAVYVPYLRLRAPSKSSYRPSSVLKPYRRLKSSSVLKSYRRLWKTIAEVKTIVDPREHLAYGEIGRSAGDFHDSTGRSADSDVEPQSQEQPDPEDDNSNNNAISGAAGGDGGDGGNNGEGEGHKEDESDQKAEEEEQDEKEEETEEEEKKDDKEEHQEDEPAEDNAPLEAHQEDKLAEDNAQVEAHQEAEANVQVEAHQEAEANAHVEERNNWPFDPKVTTEILQYLPAHERCRAAVVCRDWNRAFAPLNAEINERQRVIRAQMVQDHNAKADLLLQAMNDGETVFHALERLLGDPDFSRDEHKRLDEAANTLSILWGHEIFEWDKEILTTHRKE